MTLRRSGTALIAALVLAVGLVAGCEPRPRFPLYSSAQTTGSFGYFEEQLADGRFRVGYRAPIERAYSISRAERRREADRLVVLSYDLALLRASELALARGAGSFDISERENDVEANIEERYGYDPLFAPWPAYRYHYVPHAFYPYGPVYRERYTEVAVGVSFIAELREGAALGAFDARGTHDRLRAKYPYATGMMNGT